MSTRSGVAQRQSGRLLSGVSAGSIPAFGASGGITTVQGMKVCSGCGEQKVVTDFHRRASSRDGRSSRCKVCCSDRSKRYYQADKEKYKASARRNNPALKERNRRFVWAYLAEHPCVDCGCDEVVLLQFDHRDGTKERQCEVSNLVVRCVSIRRLLAEIAKCDVRCAHCHIKRTYIQQGWATPPDFRYTTTPS